MVVLFKKVCKRLLPSFIRDIIALKSSIHDTKIGMHVVLQRPYKISSSVVGDYSYIGPNSHISKVKIGKFCSIGPNVFAGWGIHPIEKLSTAPMFYSQGKQNGMTLSRRNKIEERAPIVIGNDVFIGVNVTILDGVKIGDGAVVGAGAVVVHDVEPYSVVGGVPAREIRKRFSQSVIERLRKIEWWNFHKEKLQLVEQYFDDVEGFLEKEEDDKV